MHERRVHSLEAAQYDLRTRSVLDTFTGRALSGPLRAKGVRLEQTTVVASAWGAWRRAHPRRRIVAEDGGIGRDYPADPLGGRDAGGPIFPTGSADPQLPVRTGRGAELAAHQVFWFA